MPHDHQAGPFKHDIIFDIHVPSKIDFMIKYIIKFLLYIAFRLLVLAWITGKLCVNILKSLNLPITSNFLFKLDDEESSWFSDEEEKIEAKKSLVDYENSDSEPETEKESKVNVTSGKLQ